MKIAGTNWSGIVKTQAELGELGLKEGQNILGRIISVTDNTVLLQLVGKTLPAQLEGQPLPPGTVALFRVKLVQSGKVALEVLSNSNPPAPGVTSESPAQPQDITYRAAILEACRKIGGAGPAVQAGPIEREMRLFTAQYSATPPAEVFVWLKMHNWPVTPGTVLFAWLHRDQDLRNLIWSRLRRLAQVKQQPELLPPVLALGSDRLEAAAPVPAEQSAVTTARYARENRSATKPEADKGLPDFSDPIFRPGVNGKEQSVWERLRPLLEQSANLDRPAAANSAGLDVTVIPFLIQITTALVSELRLEWSARPSQSGDRTGREELIRMVIPTENLGDIHLAMLVNTKKTQINLKVASPAVRDYFHRHLAELKSRLNKEIHIAVSLLPPNPADEAKVDLWM